MAMDQKPVKSKSKLLKYLPKATSAVSFQNPTNNYSPRSAQVGRGFSGPMISMIPAEARRKPKNSSFEAQEPTSPKVSCMGQIKLKHKQKHMNKSNNNNVKKTKKIVSLPKDFKGVSQSKTEEKKKSLGFKNIFGGGKERRKLDAGGDKPPVGPARAPGLSQMRRFASSRDSFANFDWTAQIAPVDSDHRNYYSSDEERGESDGEEEEVIIPFSAPILMGGGGGGIALEPKKEINLWKRRTMAKPRPLQVK